MAKPSSFTGDISADRLERSFFNMSADEILVPVRQLTLRSAA